LPKALVPVQKNLEYVLRKHYVYGYMVFFNMNICRNNYEDIRLLNEYAHDHHLATDYHINETPMLEQDEHFKHLCENPTYLRPQDWRATDELIDWIIDKNKGGYQMVNSIQRLQEMKAFVRLSSGLDIHKVGWYGDGNETDGQLEKILPSTPGIVRSASGDVQFTDWNCRAGQNNVVVRTDGTVAPCFPLYPASHDWGSIENPKFEPQATVVDEAAVPEALLLDTESQSGLLLQRCSRDQVAVETGEEPIPRRGEKLRGLAARRVNRPSAKTGVSTPPDSD
jgi:MoaA/NifB/PqqE/SkfB family radical SAM enzyme